LTPGRVPETVATLLLPVQANLSRCKAAKRGSEWSPLLVLRCLGENSRAPWLSKENEDKGQDED
jgi:hypothetical protein